MPFTNPRRAFALCKLRNGYDGSDRAGPSLPGSTSHSPTLIPAQGISSLWETLRLVAVGQCELAITEPVDEVALDVGRRLPGGEADVGNGAVQVRLHGCEGLRDVGVRRSR